MDFTNSDVIVNDVINVTVGKIGREVIGVIGDIVVNEIFVSFTEKRVIRGTENVLKGFGEQLCLRTGFRNAVTDRVNNLGMGIAGLIILDFMVFEDLDLFPEFTGVSFVINIFTGFVPVSNTLDFNFFFDITAKAINNDLSEGISIDRELSAKFSFRLDKGDNFGGGFPVLGSGIGKGASIIKGFTYNVGDVTCHFVECDSVSNIAKVNLVKVIKFSSGGVFIGFPVCFVMVSVRGGIGFSFERGGDF